MLQDFPKQKTELIGSEIIEPKKNDINELFKEAVSIVNANGIKFLKT